MQERIDGQHRLATAASTVAEPCGFDRSWRFYAVGLHGGYAPTWEVRRKAKKDDGRDDDLVVGGTADTFEAAKAAALFEATARSLE